MGHDLQPPDDEFAPRRIDQLVRRIRGLRTIGTVLHVGAHPDDEDAGLMAFMSHKYGARMVYWSATRGESGQNRLGGYAGEALGIYRTWESLAARAIDGGECLFGPFYDFGYSKNGTEATAKWGRLELVREIVRAIRLVQPFVLVARFSGEPSDGHGQHQAIGSATLEAFDAAGDAACFPELGLPAWETPKMYHSTGGDWQPGEENLLGKRRPEFEREGFLRIDTGELDPAIGLTYQQLAWHAFNRHRTQAMGFLPEPGSFYYYFKLQKTLVGSGPLENTFYDGLDPSLMGLAHHPGGGPPDLAATLGKVRASVDRALSELRPHDPAAAAGPLLEGLGVLRHLRESLERGPDADRASALARQLDSRIAAFEDVIARCLGFDGDCVAERAHVAPGGRVHVVARFWNPRGIPIDAITFRLQVPAGWKVGDLPAEAAPATTNGSAVRTASYDVVVAADASAATPYWLELPRQPYRYSLDGAFACEAFGPSQAALECELLVDGRRLTLRRPVQRREPFAGGYRELPLSVVPAVSVVPQAARVFLPAGVDRQTIELQVGIRRYFDDAGTTPRLNARVPEGWTVDPRSFDIPPGGAGDDAATRFRLNVPADASAGSYRIEYLLGENRAATLEPVWMGSPGLPRPPDAATCIREAFLAKPAQVDVHLIGARFPRGLRYGYVRGAAEGLLATMEHFGLNIHVIGDDEIGYLDLSAFDAILIGPNAYLLREQVRRNAARLLEYIAAGGTLIVQYQAYGYELGDFAPYPFRYSHPHDRVTYPDAPVSILEPAHPLMTHPNSVAEDDFSGWIHDRGLYFFGGFDKRYTPILACSDPGEEPKRGGLVVTGYGRGRFVYVAYSLFRQIPAGVPGAFRLLANLLALPEALLLERAERLKKLSFFAFMTDEQLVAVARIVSERYESAGAYLCRTGEPAQELFIVLKGLVEIVRQTEGGIVTFHAGEGQIVGEFAILADLPRTADLRASTDLHLLVISGVHFRALLRQYAEIAEKVIRQLVLKAAGESPTVCV